MRSPASRWIEAALLGAILIALASIAWRFFRGGYLPQPFIYGADGTFADWFDVAYWAHHPGAYNVWESVYPPLSFAFLKLFSISGCYASPTVHARDCDWVGDWSILIAYALAGLVAFRSLRTADRQTALVRSLALWLGLPMVFALERGNLILPCFVCFALGYGRGLRYAWLRWLSVAATINFKPYLIFAALPLAARNRWRWLEGAGIATVILYLISLAIVGSGTPVQLIRDQIDWSNFVAPQYWWNIYYSTSYAPLINAAGAPYPLLLFASSRSLEWSTLIAEVAIHVGQAAVLAALVGVWALKVATPNYRLSALGLSFIFTTTNPSGYTEVFLIFLIFLERWRGPFTATALIAAYLLSIPYDHIVVAIFGSDQSSWLSGRYVETVFGLSVGQFVRPGLVLLIEYALAAATFADIHAAVRARLRPSPGLVGAAAA
jgi:hypothetical protein